jgi:hypothetical protein
MWFGICNFNPYVDKYKMSVETSQASQVSQEIKMISSQTGIDDLILIERAYYECKANTIDTICKLMDIKQVLRNDAARETKSLMETFREILDEKDTIFQQILSESKST